MKRNLYREIKILEVKLNDTIKKYGVEHKKTVELSEKIDTLINYFYTTQKEREYPQNSLIYYYYKKSYDKLRELTDIYGEFPTIEEWSKYAKEHYLLSSESIKYISQLDWKELRMKIQRKFIIKKFV